METKEFDDDSGSAVTGIFRLFARYGIIRTRWRCFLRHWLRIPEFSNLFWKQSGWFRGTGESMEQNQ